MRGAGRFIAPIRGSGGKVGFSSNYAALAFVGIVCCVFCSEGVDRGA